MQQKEKKETTPGSEESTDKKFKRRTNQELEKNFRCPVSTCQKLFGSYGSHYSHLKVYHEIDKEICSQLVTLEKVRIMAQNQKQNKEQNVCIDNIQKKLNERTYIEIPIKKKLKLEKKEQIKQKKFKKSLPKVKLTTFKPPIKEKLKKHKHLHKFHFINKNKFSKQIGKIKHQIEEKKTKKIILKSASQDDLTLKIFSKEIYNLLISQETGRNDLQQIQKNQTQIDFIFDQENPYKRQNQGKDEKQENILLKFLIRRLKVILKYLSHKVQPTYFDEICQFSKVILKILCIFKYQNYEELKNDQFKFEYYVMQLLMYGIQEEKFKTLKNLGHYYVSQIVQKFAKAIYILND